jgi:hypothetical protein
MSLPSLAHWEITRDSLHQASQVLKFARLATLKPLPHYLHHSLQVVPEGLSTGLLPFGGELVLDCLHNAVTYRQPEREAIRVSLAGRSLATLSKAVADVLAKAGHPLELAQTELTSDRPLMIDPATAEDYAHALYSVFTATARFRARLLGSMSPIVVWPHHFDLSFLWFATDKASEQAPHMNFGFAPFSEGLPRPYLYVYAWPIPAGLMEVKLPARAHRHTSGWKGVLVHYDDLVNEGEPETVIEEILDDLYRSIAPLLSVAGS